MKKIEMEKLQKMENKAWNKLGAYRAYLAYIHADSIVLRRCYALQWETDNTLSAQEVAYLSRLRSYWCALNDSLDALGIPHQYDGPNYGGIEYAAERGIHPADYLQDIGVTVGDLVDVWMEEV